MIKKSTKTLVTLFQIFRKPLLHPIYRAEALKVLTSIVLNDNICISSGSVHNNSRALARRKDQILLRFVLYVCICA